MAEKCTFCEKVHFFAKWASADLKKEHTYKGFGAPAPEGPILAKKCTFCTFGADRVLVSQRDMNHGVWDRSPTRPPLRPRAAWGLCPRRHGRSAPRRHSRSAPRGRETPPLSMPWSGCWRTPPTPISSIPFLKVQKTRCGFATPREPRGSKSCPRTQKSFI